jgi:Caspase domain
VSDEVVPSFRPKLQWSVQNNAPATGGSEGTFSPPKADLVAVRKAAKKWCERLQANRENMAVFFFCGHGTVHGPPFCCRTSVSPGTIYEGAIDVNSLLGTMKNSPAVEQMFLFDCCRTKADDLYQNEERIGSRIVSWAHEQPIIVGAEGYSTIDLPGGGRLNP